MVAAEAGAGDGARKNTLAKEVVAQANPSTIRPIMFRPDFGAASASGFASSLPLMMAPLNQKLFSCLNQSLVKEALTLSPEILTKLNRNEKSGI